MALDTGLAVWTLITFAGLMAVLARYAFRPLRDVLAAREATIRHALERAEQARLEAEQSMSANRRQADQAREETRRIIAEGHRVVSEMKREAQQRSREEASFLVSQARAEIEREVQRGLDNLKGTVVDLSVRIARQVIKGELDDSRHRALAEDLVERIKAHADRKT